MYAATAQRAPISSFSKARHTLYVNMLETSADVRAFCRKHSVRISDDSMQICFTAQRDVLELLIETHLASDAEVQRKLKAQLVRTF